MLVSGSRSVPRNASRRASGGFTFVELVFVLLVLGVLVSVSAPSFTNLIVAQRLR